MESLKGMLACLALREHACRLAFTRRNGDRPAADRAPVGGEAIWTTPDPARGCATKH
jgi:hypothetical protein